MQFQFGLDVLLASATQLHALGQKRCALVAHPASVTSDLDHSLDALIQAGCSIIKAFGPQHGMRGDKQDNMIESDDYLDPRHNIPVVSLYGEHRRPTAEMLADVDLVLFDLQDVGCRIYTYITTLKYFVEVCDAVGVALWVLDRPNPAGRSVDGLILESGHESFVGCDLLPMRHGLTACELATWFKARNNLNTRLHLVPMTAYQPDTVPGFGWPTGRNWVNPSPNAASLNMTLCFSGTVLLEGTTLSEGRGTTVPLEVIGAPNFPAEQIIACLRREAPHWLEGIRLRSCFFEPTFHKYQGELCSGIQIHADSSTYKPDKFKPYRLIAGCLKVLRRLHPDYDLWCHHPYEYELHRLPVDVINGGEKLRRWVDDDGANFANFDRAVEADAQTWRTERAPYLLYP